MNVRMHEDEELIEKLEHLIELAKAGKIMECSIRVGLVPDDYEEEVKKDKKKYECHEDESDEVFKKCRCECDDDDDDDDEIEKMASSLKKKIREVECGIEIATRLKDHREIPIGLVKKYNDCVA